METVFLQLTRRSLLLTPVRKSGRQHIYATPVRFELPEGLCGKEKAASQMHALAVFASDCMQKARMANCELIVCLDNTAVITKEYLHLPTKKAELQKFARLEAETVLQDNVDGYYIVTQEYGHQDAASGRLKAILFAVPKSLITSIVQDFRSVGIRVARICPMLNGMMMTCQNVVGLSPKKYMYSNRTVAVVDAGWEHLRVMLFSNGEPVFQREFDSVWPDILEIMHNEGGYSYEEAESEIMQPGFLAANEKTQVPVSEKISPQIKVLLETATSEAGRNLHVILSAERLQPEEIIFCGAFSVHPDFKAYMKNVSTGIPFQPVQSACERYRSFIAIDTQAAISGCHPEDFFSLDGMLSRYGEVDFISQEKGQYSGKQLNLILSIIFCIFAAALISIEPILCHNASEQVNADNVKLALPEIQQAKSMLDKENSLKQQLTQIQKDDSVLPYQKSKMTEAFTKLNEQLAPQVNSITSCKADGKSGTFDITFTTSTFGQFNSARQSVNSKHYFDVLVPFTAARQQDEKAKQASYLCTAKLQIHGFANPVSSNSASSAS